MHQKNASKALILNKNEYNKNAKNALQNWKPNWNLIQPGIGCQIGYNTGVFYCEKGVGKATTQHCPISGDQK